jgi:hypothetical protein
MKTSEIRRFLNWIELERGANLSIMDFRNGKIEHIPIQAKEIALDYQLHGDHDRHLRGVVSEIEVDHCRREREKREDTYFYERFRSGAGIRFLTWLEGKCLSVLLAIRHAKMRRQGIYVKVRDVHK